MARPKYRIPDSERWVAEQWLRGQLDKIGFPENLGKRPELRKRSKLDVIDEFRAADSGEALTAFCERWLTSAEWDRMKVSIRASRKRKRDKIDNTKPVSLDLSKQAHYVLATIAKRDGVTLSEVIEKYLDCEYGKALDQARKR